MGSKLLFTKGRFHLGNLRANLLPILLVSLIVLSGGCRPKINFQLEDETGSKSEKDWIDLVEGDVVVKPILSVNGGGWYCATVQFHFRCSPNTAGDLWVNPEGLVFKSRFFEFYRRIVSIPGQSGAQRVLVPPGGKQRIIVECLSDFHSGYSSKHMPNDEEIEIVVGGVYWEGKELPPLVLRYSIKE